MYYYWAEVDQRWSQSLRHHTGYSTPWDVRLSHSRRQHGFICFIWQSYSNQQHLPSAHHVPERGVDLLPLAPRGEMAIMSSPSNLLQNKIKSLVKISGIPRLREGGVLIRVCIILMAYFSLSKTNTNS